MIFDYPERARESFLRQQCHSPSDSGFNLRVRLIGDPQNNNPRVLIGWICLYV